MKLTLRTLQLFALCEFVTASPCKPPSSSPASGLATSDSTAEGSTSTESITFSEKPLFYSTTTETETATGDGTTTTTTELVAASASTATFEAVTDSNTWTVFTGFTTTSGATSEATATSESILYTSFETDTEAGTETTRIEPTTTSDGITSSEDVTTSSTTVMYESETSTEMETEARAETAALNTESFTTSQAIATSGTPLISTTSAEPTTTTSTLPQTPTNLLYNPSFEDDAFSPWTPVSGGQGSISLSTSQSRTGAQSVRMNLRGSSAYIRQQIDPSRLKPNTMYELTVHTKASIQLQSPCAARQISCAAGSTPAGGIREGSSARSGAWEPLRVSCAWSQTQLDAEPYVRIFLTGCVDMEWFVDDVTLIEVV